MAQRRMLSKSISTSAKLSEVSNFAKLAFTWAIPHCDDFGHLDATPKVFRATVLPLCNETVEQVAEALLELEKAGLITFYYENGRRYLEIVKWAEHQTFKTDRPKVSLFPRNLRKPKVSKRKPNGNIVRLSEVKLSEVNISEVKGSEIAGTSPAGKEINEMIDLFKDVNPSHTKFFSNTTQRSAVERMLKKIGVQKLIETINTLKITNQMKFAPSITTPLQLEDKMGALLAFVAKESIAQEGKKIKEL